MTGNPLQITLYQPPKDLTRGGFPNSRKRDSMQHVVDSRSGQHVGSRDYTHCVSFGAIALLILDSAGWHGSPPLVVPANIVLLPLPPYAPELSSTENLWEYLRSNWLSHCVWDSYQAILDACCDAWNALMAKSEVITSIGTRDWAQVRI